MMGDPFAALDELAGLFWQNAEDKGFHEAEHRSFERELMLICSEAFEAFEDHRNGKKVSDKIPEFTAYEEELSDMLIRILETARDNGMRIGAATKAKYNYNHSRPPKHGKAF